MKVDKLKKIQTTSIRFKIFLDLLIAIIFSERQLVEMMFIVDSKNRKLLVSHINKKQSVINEVI